MNRAFSIAIAALLGTACVSEHHDYVPPGGGYSDVVVYWTFSRDLLNGSTVTYDANVNPGGGSAACPQSGVQTVDVTYPDGTPVDASSVNIPCIYSGVQGATLPTVFPAGANSVVVTGRYKGVAVFQARVDFNIVLGADNRVTALLPGVQGDLAADFTFAGSVFATCGDANVQRFDYTLRDGAGTVVGQGSAACTATQAPGLAFGPVDLDEYSLSVDAVNTTGAQPVITDSVCQAAFTHLGASDVARLDLQPGACPNP